MPEARRLKLSLKDVIKISRKDFLSYLSKYVVTTSSYQWITIIITHQNCVDTILDNFALHDLIRQLKDR